MGNQKLSSALMGFKDRFFFKSWNRSLGLVSGLHPDFPLYCLCHMASSLPASHHLSQLKQEGEFVSSCTSAGASSKWTESRIWNLVSHVLVFSLVSLQVHLIPFYSTLTFSKWAVLGFHLSTFPTLEKGSANSVKIQIVNIVGCAGLCWSLVSLVWSLL